MCYAQKKKKKNCVICYCVTHVKKGEIYYMLIVFSTKRKKNPCFMLLCVIYVNTWRKKSTLYVNCFMHMKNLLYVVILFVGADTSLLTYMGNEK